jgi:hypothetical protein
MDYRQLQRDPAQAHEARTARRTQGGLQWPNLVDQERAEFIEKYFHLEWPSRSIYHAMLNTGVGDEIVIDAILRLKKAVEQQTEAGIL